MRSLLFAPLFAIAVAATGLAAAGAPAAEAPLVVDRGDALRRGASSGPGVALAAAPMPAARDAERASAALPRPPVVTFGGGWRAGTIGPGVELGASITQDVALRGLGDARSQAARAMQRVVASDTSRARLDAAARAAFAWATMLEMKEVVRLREDALAQAEAIAKAAQARVSSGVGQPYELALARGDVGAAHAAVLDAEGDLVDARAELRFALGVAAAAPIDVAGDLYATDDRTPNELAVVRGAETSHPSVLLAEARADLAHREVGVVAATLGPTISFGASYVREGTGDQVWTGLVGLPLPIMDPAGFETARQRAAEQAALAQIERARAEVARDVRLALHEREHWREVRDALRAEALAPSREALRLARVALEAGTQDVQSVLLARTRLAMVEEQYAHVAGAVQRADIELGRAAGTLLRGGGPP